MMKQAHNIRHMILLISFFVSVQLWGMGASPQPQTDAMQFYITVPPAHKESLHLLDPPNALVTTQNTILVRGTNTYLTEVFVNGDKVDVQADGQFSYTLPLESHGKHFILVTFVTPDQSYVTIGRKVISLLPPPQTGINATLTLEDMYFFNTKYVPKESISEYFPKYLDRALLAYFLSVIHGYQPFTLEAQLFDDVPLGFYADGPIYYAVYQSLLATDSSELFMPQKPISKNEYIESSLKALGLSLTTKQMPLPYKDVAPIDPNYTNIQTAYQNKLLPDETFLNPSERLNLQEFAYLASHIREVAKEIKEAKSFQSGFQSESVYLNAMASVESFMVQKSMEEMLRMGIFWESPEDIVFTNTAMFRGKINPSQAFFISGKKYLPESDGQFEIELALNEGKNIFAIDAFDERVFKSIWKIPTYKDLNGHWIEQKASMLRYAALLPKTTVFSPNLEVTRGYFCDYIAAMFQLKAKNQNPLPFRDVAKDSRAYEAIKAVFDHGVLKGTPKGYFNPDAPMKKIEALVAVIRMGNHTPVDPVVLDMIDLPYSDVSSYRWAEKELKTGLYYEVIAPFPALFPDKIINKAELTSLVFNTPQVQESLEEVFQ